MPVNTGRWALSIGSFQSRQFGIAGERIPVLQAAGSNVLRMANKHLQPTPVLMLKVEAAFLANGYQSMTMEQLAEACNFSRRALYFYFSSKSDAFRTVV